MKLPSLVSNSFIPEPVRIFIFQGSVCLFCSSKLGGPIMGIYKSLTDTWRWKLGTRLGSVISGNTHKLDLLFSAGETSSTFSYCSRQPGPMKGIAKTPDHDIFYHLARVYATNHLSMLDQTQCKRWYFEVCSWYIIVWDLVLWGTLLTHNGVGFSTLQ